jgi:hypothetical protein
MELALLLEKVDLPLSIHIRKTPSVIVQKYIPANTRNLPVSWVNYRVYLITSLYPFYTRPQFLTIKLPVNSQDYH